MVVIKENYVRIHYSSWEGMSYVLSFSSSGILFVVVTRTTNPSSVLGQENYLCSLGILKNKYKLLLSNFVYKFLSIVLKITTIKKLNNVRSRYFRKLMTYSENIWTLA